MNRAEFIGNLGSDARIGKVGEKTVANFTLAVNEKSGGQEITTWVSCAVWGQLADAVGKYLTKGKPVFVDGPVSIEEYTTKDGEVRRQLSIRTVNTLRLLGGEKSPAATAAKPRDPDANPFG